MLRAAWGLSAPSLDPALRRNPLYGDAYGYVLLAENLVKSHVFSWDGRSPTSFRVPGYPIFLAVFYPLGDPFQRIVCLLQAVLGALIIFPVFAIARDLGGKRVAAFAALGTAFHPLLIYMTGWLYSETLYIFLLWVALWLLLKAILETRPGFGAFSGLIFGIATLVRPEIMPFPLFLSVWGWFCDWLKKQWRLVVVVQLITLGVILPWSIRSTILSGGFVLLTTSAGSNFYAGNNPDSLGGSAWEFPLQGVSELESDRDLFQRALDWIRLNPTKAFAALPLKLYRFFSPAAYTMEGPIAKWEGILYWIYLGFLLMAGWGIWKSWRQVAGVILTGIIGWYMLIALVYYGGTRVALPIAPALVIFAALGVLDLYAKWRVK